MEEKIAQGIYVTLGKDQITERGYGEIVRDFTRCDGANFIYYWRLHTKPKKEFTTVYIVVGNKVRWKAKFIGYEAGELRFSDGRQMSSPVWLQLMDFETMLPRPLEAYKGFQGFRYKR